METAMDDKKPDARTIAEEAVGEARGAPIPDAAKNKPATEEVIRQLATSAGPQAGMANKTAEAVGERAGDAYADGTMGEAIECQGKDISLSGIGFYLPRELPTPRICIKLPRTAQTPAVSAPASIVRVQRCGAGWYEVGALFLPPNADG